MTDSEIIELKEKEISKIKINRIITIHSENSVEQGYFLGYDNIKKTIKLKFLNMSFVIEVDINKMTRLEVHK